MPHNLSFCEYLLFVYIILGVSVTEKANMSCVLVLLSVIVLSGDGIISEGASRPHVVNVGAIFGLNTLHGKVAYIAMKAAEDDVNSDPSFLGGSKLRILMNDAKRSGFLSIIGGE